MCIQSGSVWLVRKSRHCCATLPCLCQNGRSITAASYIVKPLWDIDWDFADFGLRSAEWHFAATRCLTTPLVVTSVNGRRAGVSALKSWKM